MKRVATKLFGFVATLAPFALAYWAFPEYNGAFYDPFYELFRRFWPGLVLATILYFAVVDTHMRQPEDVYWRLGRIVLGKRDRGAPGELANHYRGWLVKAYFFPLMFVWLHEQHEQRDPLRSDARIMVEPARLRLPLRVHLLHRPRLLTTCRLTRFASARSIRTHPHRGADDARLGGRALLLHAVLQQSDGKAVRPLRRLGERGSSGGSADTRSSAGFGPGSSSLLITIYVLATITFGVRFSNLTNRGILTNGPYRFTKHPAYVSKNLSWWLTAVPFVISDDVSHAIRRCVMLGVVNFMYFMRAKTEERHLSRDPTYVAYATWMNAHGWLRFLGRIPLLGAIFRYEPPASPETPVVSGPFRTESKPVRGDQRGMSKGRPARRGSPRSRQHHSAGIAHTSRIVSIVEIPSTLERRNPSR